MEMLATAQAVNMKVLWQMKFPQKMKWLWVMEVFVNNLLFLSGLILNNLLKSYLLNNIHELLLMYQILVGVPQNMKISLNFTLWKPIFHWKGMFLDIYVAECAQKKEEERTAIQM
jgi:hypothetical protein